MNTVLIVEDEPAIIKSLGNFISRLGISVLMSDNGNEALTLIKQHRPQLVILDINIPGLKGLDVLKETKKAVPQTKVAIITGDIAEELREEAFQNGALTFLNKPFTLQDIQKVLADCGLIKAK